VSGELLSREAFIGRLREEGARRYHDHHPFHVRMHEGKLSRAELQAWVLNRYYYQTRIPIKDALVLAKAEDPAFRRLWIHRIHDHDGDAPDKGGLALWLRLAEAVGLDKAEVASCAKVLPGVRFACDAYVELVRGSPLVVAVASSLTEMFAPDIMSKRIAAWQQHYPWVGAEALGYFQVRVTRARMDGEEGSAYVAAHATTRDLQDQCVAALVRKTEILWHLVDCVERATSATSATSAPGSSPGAR
jgi:pyrroloquinoline-quinone synthase